MNNALSITRSIHDWLFSIMSESVASIVEMVLIALVYLGIFAVAGLFLVLIDQIELGIKVFYKPWPTH